VATRRPYLSSGSLWWGEETRKPRAVGGRGDELITIPEVQRLLDRGADPEVPDILEKSKMKRVSCEDFKKEVPKNHGFSCLK